MEELRRLWDFSWWWSSSRAAIIAYILSNIMRKVVGRNYICNYIISSFCPTNNIVYSADPAILLSVFRVGFCPFDFSSKFYRRTTQVLRSLPEYFLLFYIVYYFIFTFQSFLSENITLCRYWRWASEPEEQLRWGSGLERREQSHGQAPSLRPQGEWLSPSINILSTTVLT